MESEPLAPAAIARGQSPGVASFSLGSRATVAEKGQIGIPRCAGVQTAAKSGAFGPTEYDSTSTASRHFVRESLRKSASTMSTRAPSGGAEPAEGGRDEFGLRCAGSSPRVTFDALFRDCVVFFGIGLARLSGAHGARDVPPCCRSVERECVRTTVCQVVVSGQQLWGLDITSPAKRSAANRAKFLALNLCCLVGRFGVARRRCAARRSAAFVHFGSSSFHRADTESRVHSSRVLTGRRAV